MIWLNVIYDFDADNRQGIGFVSEYPFTFCRHHTKISLADESWFLISFFYSSNNLIISWIGQTAIGQETETCWTCYKCKLKCPWMYARLTKSDYDLLRGIRKLKTIIIIIIIINITKIEITQALISVNTQPTWLMALLHSVISAHPHAHRHIP